ncbi:sensor histidine kinase [Marinospirillum alkaliphilum]|uniref:histidine kinase n=1 Tax=Marinospirillum alkaliphilum DSM 21637 TaxID=1122209 RepID=A0A1K1X2Z0_9GAMM|nr:sensor histidine kinase [Marinospirillum alkaliphilum]SFX44016.1 HAMP domain-containing protein [Marinospirillum alkaliphilum DSM 21637]
MPDVHKRTEPVGWSLRNKLLLLLLALFVLAGGGNALLLKYFIERDSMVLLLQTGQEEVEMLVQRIDRVFDRRQQVLESLAASLLEQNELAAAETLEQRITAPGLSQVFFGYVVMDAEGQILADSPVVPGRRGSSVWDRAYIQENIRTGQTVRYPPTMGRFSSIPISIFSVPIFVDNLATPKGFLVGYQPLDSEPLFEQIRSEYDRVSSDLLIMDLTAQRYVSASNPALTLQPIASKDPLFRQLQQGIPSGRFVDAAGQDWLYVATTQDSTGWTLVKLRQMQPITELLNSWVRHNLLVLGLALLLGGLFAGWLLHRLLGPVHRSLQQMREVLQLKKGYQHLQVDRQDEIGQLLQAFNELQEQRDRQEQLKDELVSVVSHELRTPLTSARGALALLRSKDLAQQPEQQARLMDMADRNVNRLIVLVNDLLDLASLTKGSLKLDLQCVALQPILYQTVEDFTPYAQEQGVRVSLKQPTGPLLVMVDPGRLNQVLTNLLSNAVKFSPKNTEVEVVVTRRQDTVRIMVTDQGEGIPLAFQSRVFERFAQADKSDRRRNTGTGLGLAITRELTTAMNGRIGFSSLPGSGSCFFLDLPRLDNKNGSDHPEENKDDH